MSTVARKLAFGLGVIGASGILLAADALFPQQALAQNCASFDPADWPAPSKPYFMLVVDTSGSMNCCTTPAQAGCASGANPVWECNSSAAGYALNSCGMVPSRLNDSKCALRKTVQAFAGEVNFGMATYARTLSACGAGSCASGVATVSDCGVPATSNGSVCNPENYGCTVSNFPDNSGGTGCGNFPHCLTNGSQLPSPPNFAEGTWRNAANIVVPMLADPVMGAPPASNVPTLLEWFDESCLNDRELFADGATPMAGSLRGVAQYLRSGWEAWTAGPAGMTAGNYCTNNPFTHGTPMSAADRACRSINVLLVTDGDETCDTQADAVAAAQDLFQNGVTLGATNWDVRVHVINFAGGSTTNTDAIAAAGGTGASVSATNEATLAQALSGIIAGSIQPEVCNNGDDNCNGCIDEGSVKYCNQLQNCCTWTTAQQRLDCLDDYTTSLTTNPPDGNPELLPCTTVAQQSQSANWLCFDPGDECDNADNNCVAGIDEGATKCGNPAHCPLPEVCGGGDDDCDGAVDEGGVCATCNPSAEVCDGCDNDCDGMTDDGILPVACGFSPPANCAGQITCDPPQAVTPGGCIPGNGFNTCTATPGTDNTCDGIDQDCDGVPDDGAPAVACLPPGTPAGLFYNPPNATSQCVRGTQPCGGTCTGFIGPSAEICDGIDNDCDGTVDDSPFGVGQQCGVNTPPCSPGLTACVNGALVCQGGVQPTGEQCDGADNDCDGLTDEAPLSDAPLPGQNGCWNVPGNNCNHDNLSWNAPPGATCNTVGTLTQPCNTGTLTCAGAQQWICQGGTPPAGEVCDGVDNDCDGTPDDGTFPTEGQLCGLPVLPCVQGTIQCTAGTLDCVGDVPPQSEVCNGIDDNCDTIIDNGIPIGGPCTIAYDMLLYPGDRSAPPCQPGHFECDGLGGLECVDGVGPSPEICDGIDNDCDGEEDETGAAPDGIDGSANPFPPPAGNIGDVCGTSEGQCEPGALACVNGAFTCLGGQAPQFETCDCSDEDCNGVQDNENTNDTPPLCGESKDCVVARGACQCAAPCDSGEFPCPTGQVCTAVNASETGLPLGNYCLVESCPGGCDDATNTDADGNVLCAPEGTEGEDCEQIPECVCKGQNGCRRPCFGVTCDAPLVCTDFGEDAGQCVADNCFNLGCQACGQACSDDGQCVANPCTEDSCEDDEVCKPSDDLLSFTCVPSCAEVECQGATVCEDGMCVPTCEPPCAAGLTCDQAQDPPTCVDDLCEEDSCPNGGCCDPISGACGNCPCEGIICPDGQECTDGECDTASEGGGGQGGGGGDGGNGPEGGGGEGQGAGNEGAAGTGGPDENGVWGLATGGGGCACDVGAREGTDHRLSLLGVLVGLALLRGKRRRRGKARTHAVVSSGEVAR